MTMQRRFPKGTSIEDMRKMLQPPQDTALENYIDARKAEEEAEAQAKQILLAARQHVATSAALALEAGVPARVLASAPPTQLTTSRIYQFRQEAEAAGTFTPTPKKEKPVEVPAPRAYVGFSRRVSPRSHRKRTGESAAISHDE